MIEDQKGSVTSVLRIFPRLSRRCSGIIRWASAVPTQLSNLSPGAGIKKPRSQKDRGLVVGLGCMVLSYPCFDAFYDPSGYTRVGAGEPNAPDRTIQPGDHP